jgi:hypothetical protein
VPIESVHAVAGMQFGCDLDDWRHAARRKPRVECRDMNQVAEKRRLECRAVECRPLPPRPVCERDERCLTPCPAFVGWCEERRIYEMPSKICRARRPRDIERILLERAYLGLLTRMRTFDWQVIHGHVLGIKNGSYFDIYV